MAVTHVNRKGQTFYLHETRTKTGKPKYSFSMKDDGVLVGAIPGGYEVHENPDAQVFLRKTLPRFITDHEVALVRLTTRHFCYDGTGDRLLGRERSCVRQNIIHLIPIVNRLSIRWRVDSSQRLSPAWITRDPKARAR
jgi:hypothetical protein